MHDLDARAAARLPWCSRAGAVDNCGPVAPPWPFLGGAMPAAVLAAAVLYAAALPRVAYRPNPASQGDVGTVTLSLPRNQCFGILRGQVLLSSQKSDRRRLYVLSVTVADSVSPGQITGAEAGGAGPLKLVSVRNGDVACTEYQCPQGSAGVFELDGAALAAGRAAPLAVKVHTSAGGACDPTVEIEPAVFQALDAWAETLPAAKG
jgi:hypothetical protein